MAETQSAGGHEGATIDTSIQAAAFAPLFVVVEDTATGEQHHPHVEYVFSSDDPDHLTSAVLHSLQNGEIQDEDERTLVVDLDESGRQVTAVKSLSPDWQVSATRLSQAPTFAGSAGSQVDETGLMLRVQGCDSSAARSLLAGNATAGPTDESAQDRTERLKAHLDMLSTAYASNMAALNQWAQT